MILEKSRDFYIKFVKIYVFLKFIFNKNYNKYNLNHYYVMIKRNIRKYE